MAFLQDLANRRLPADERVRQQAFVAEISDTWQPATPGERLLAFEAHAVHLAHGLFGGGPTLLQVAGPAALTAVGFALRAMAPAPHDASLVSGVPRGVTILFVLALTMLAREVVLAPREIHRVRFALVVLLPIGVAALARAALMDSESWFNVPVRVATAGIGLSQLLILVAAARARGGRLFRSAVLLESVSALGLVLAECARGLAYTADGDTLLAVASVCIGGGVALLGLTLYRSHPERLVAPEPSPAA